MRFDDDATFSFVRCDLRNARLSGSRESNLLFYLPYSILADSLLRDFASFPTAPPYRAVLETLFDSLLVDLNRLPLVRLSSLKDDDLLDWYTNKARNVERGFQEVLDQHRKAQEAAEAALRENESRFVFVLSLRVGLMSSLSFCFASQIQHDARRSRRHLYARQE